MTFPRQIFLLALSAFMGLVLTGCQPSDPDSPKVAVVTSIAVTPNPVNLEIGGVRSLTVTGTFSDSSTFVVNFGTTFVSSAPAVATVARDTGYVTAVAAGTATITATHTDSGKTATTTVSVSPLRVLSIAVSPASSTLAPGTTAALTVTATYNNLTTGAETSRSTFASSNAAVAVVDAAGIVTAVAAGVATITATHTASGKTATSAITVGTGGGGGGGFVDITFDSAGVAYTLTGFGGAGDSTLVPDPTNASNVVARVVKSSTAELWAGTTVSTGAN
ncbi:MAG: Ig-like domain-containing protein, partial [Steroidobacteraceae bacterium]